MKATKECLEPESGSSAKVSLEANPRSDSASDPELEPEPLAEGGFSASSDAPLATKNQHPETETQFEEESSARE